MSSAEAVPARVERRLSRRLRRSLSDLGALGGAASWIWSASVQAPVPGTAAGDVAVSVYISGLGYS